MITFLAQPETIEPSYGNLVFQFYSTGATDPTKYRYRYVVEIYTPEGLISTQTITPATEGWGQIDLSPILRNYTFSNPINQGCSGTTPIFETQWAYLDSNMIVYSIKVGEEYSLTPNGIPILYNGMGNTGSPQVRSNVCYTYNGVKEWFNGKNYDFTPYYLTGQTGTFPQLTSRYMTNSPRSRYARETDNLVLAGLNWMKQDEVIDSRGVYSGLFTFYDDANSVISTGRTYNIYSGCGTRPNCSYFDRYWISSNWYEQQVIYLGCGKPNIEAHGIVFPSTTKYWKVELEATSENPNPGSPQPQDIDGCSCHQYSGSSVIDGTEIEYYDCLGNLVNQVVDAGQTFLVCACQNTIGYALYSGSTIVDLGECDACVCKTYEISNSDPDNSYTYTGLTCSGTTFSGSVAADTQIEVCACENSITAQGGMSVSLIGDCPLPFTADCRTFALTTNVGYVLEVPYTGCCGTIETISMPPGVSVELCANYPPPISVLWDFTELTGLTNCDNYTCPEPPIPPQAVSVNSGDSIICRNVCDDSVWYFRYSGETINVGQYINYYDTAFEITGVGGGGFIDLYRPFVFDDEAQALAAYPCPVITTGACKSTIVISEPFYFYLDENCSPGDRQIYFLNKMGTWDTYNFRAREDVGYGVEKQEYKSVPELYNTGWDTPSYNGYNERTRVFSQNVRKSGVLYTDFMPQSEMIWLSEELFQSPSVYMLNDNGYYEPIIITNTEVAVPNYQIESSKYQITIEYKSSYDTIRQYHE
jgi:hypothetical protein